MGLTWVQFEPWFVRNVGWMRDDVQKAFHDDLNVTTLLQVCSYTEAMARLQAGTDTENPGDGDRVFPVFMRQYFDLFNECARKLGKFYVCSDRKRLKTRHVDACEAFYLLWRHGVAHEYLPKAGSPVSRTSTDGDQPYLKLRANRSGPIVAGHHTKRLHVHLDYLVNDFITAAAAFEQDVLVSGRRTQLGRNCMARFRFGAK